MAVRGAIELRRIHLSRRGARPIPVPSLELWPGIIATVRAAVANSRARRHLAGSIELAARGRETGIRV